MFARFSLCRDKSGAKFRLRLGVLQIQGRRKTDALRHKKPVRTLCPHRLKNVLSVVFKHVVK